MLLAPCKEGYEDAETKRDYYALQEAIRCGDDEFARALLANYEVESDNYEKFNTDLNYVLDADLDGVYLYTSCSPKETFERMNLADCISFWNNTCGFYCRFMTIHKMSEEDWWNELSNRLGAWDLIHAVMRSGEDFNDSDMYFFYDDGNCQMRSFSTKNEMIAIIGKEWFIDELTNER